MQFTIRNQADIPNSNIRFIKWKLRLIQEKFSEMIYSDIHISSEGNNFKIFQAVARIGVPGYDIIVKEKSDTPMKLMSKLSNIIERQLRKRKLKTNKIINA